MSDRFSLKGQRALITGASRGLGHGCAEALAEAGAAVILMGRSEKDLQTAAMQIGKSASVAACDVDSDRRIAARA